LPRIHCSNRLPGEGHLTIYFGRHHPFDGERTVAVERRLMSTATSAPPGRGLP